MKILLTGKNGQVGYELERSLQHLGEVVAVDRSQMDLNNFDQIRTVIRTVKPTLIVNPAAYTAVDKAESEPALAMRVNGIAPGIMAEEAAKIGASMIHYSTDYVFDGNKESPYFEDDIPCPLSVYGKTKLAGEAAVKASGIAHLILRTSWVYGGRGKNFMQTVLRLAAERDELRIVNDQYGAPTWSRTIAETTAYIIGKCSGRHIESLDMHEVSGVYHLTAQGSTTWYGFTKAILENLSTVRPRVIPIKTEDYPTPALRPKSSKLSSDLLIRTFCKLPEWRSALALCQQ